jgi:hypothetical protein
MSSHWFDRRKVIVWLVVVCVFAACSKVNEIPREQMGAAEHRKPADYHIWMKAGDDYLARLYSVTDSTVVIQELQQSDLRDKKQDMPIIVPLENVERITVLKKNYWVLVPVGVAIATILTLSILIGPLDYGD